MVLRRIDFSAPHHVPCKEEAPQHGRRGCQSIGKPLVAMARTSPTGVGCATHLATHGGGRGLPCSSQVWAHDLGVLTQRFLGEMARITSRTTLHHLASRAARKQHRSLGMYPPHDFVDSRTRTGHTLPWCRGLHLACRHTGHAPWCLGVRRACRRAGHTPPMVSGGASCVQAREQQRNTE